MIAHNKLLQLTVLAASRLRPAGDFCVMCVNNLMEEGCNAKQDCVHSIFCRDRSRYNQGFNDDG